MSRYLVSSPGLGVLVTVVIVVTVVVVVVRVVVMCSFPSDTMIVSETTGLVSLRAIFSSCSESLAVVQRVKRHNWQSASGRAGMS